MAFTRLLNLLTIRRQIKLLMSSQHANFSIIKFQLFKSKFSLFVQAGSLVCLGLNARLCSDFTVLNCA